MDSACLPLWLPFSVSDDLTIPDSAKLTKELLQFPLCHLQGSRRYFASELHTHTPSPGSTYVDRNYRTADHKHVMQQNSFAVCAVKGLLHHASLVAIYTSCQYWLLGCFHFLGVCMQWLFRAEAHVATSWRKHHLLQKQEELPNRILARKLSQYCGGAEPPNRILYCVRCIRDNAKSICMQDGKARSEFWTMHLSRNAHIQL